MTELVDVHFQWRVTGFECQDCGLPACFRGWRYGSTSMTADLCAVCAANCAADGCPIERIVPLDAE
jgi:hypothetical protein